MPLRTRQTVEAGLYLDGSSGCISQRRRRDPARMSHFISLIWP